MKDKPFLHWMYERLILVHKENSDMDYMHKFNAIIEAMPEDRVTPNIAGKAEGPNLPEGFGEVNPPRNTMFMISNGEHLQVDGIWAYRETPETLSVIDQTHYTWTFYRDKLIWSRTGGIS